MRYVPLGVACLTVSILVFNCPCFLAILAGLVVETLILKRQDDLQEEFSALADLVGSLGRRPCHWETCPTCD